MKQRWKYPFAVMTLAAVLTTGTAMPSHVMADGAKDTTAIEEVVAGELPSIGSISIGGSNTIELKQASLSNAAESGRIVTFTLTVNNQGNNEIQFIDYWVRLKSSSGTSFPVTLFAADKDKNRIPAKSSMDFRFYAKVNDKTNLEDLSFNFIQWDFSRSDFEKPIGSIAIPKDYSLLTAVGSKRMATIGNEPMKNGIKRVSVSKNDTHFLPTIYFEMENTGKRGAKLPELQFNLRTAEGLLYPLNVSGIDKETVINPLVKKEVTLTGSIPIDVNESGWQLQIAETVDLGNNQTVQVPIAEFILPDSTKEEVSVGRDYEFSNEDGTYGIRLEELKRLPWEDEDLLTAQVTLKNNGTQSLSIPNLTGYFKLDDAVTVDATVIRGDKVIGLQPGQEITVQYLGKIPYTYDFSDVKLYVQEKKETSQQPAPGVPGGDNSGGGKVEDLIQFVHNSDMMVVPAVGSGQKQKIDDVGRKAQYSVREVHTFTGKTGNIVVAMVEVENLEKRFNEVSKLVAHFVNPDGEVYPLNISELKSKVSPGGKALLHLSGVLPQGAETNDMQLFIGQAVKEGKLAGKEDVPDAYIQPLAFALPLEKSEPSDDLRNIELFPYTLSMKNIGTTMNFLSGDLKFSFDYEFGKDILVVSNTENHKLVIEIEDSDGKFQHAQEFSLESSAESGGGGQPGGGGNTLQLGSHTAVVNINDPELVFKLESLDKYKLNVYYQFQPGQRKLITSKELKWFYTAD